MATSSIQIGTLTIESPCILAPLAGISDLPFRMLNRSFGCKAAFAPMISARSLTGRSEKTKRLLAADPADTPLGIQLLGADPEALCKALEILEGYAYHLIDFNAACPVSKVTRRGEGAHLLTSPRKLAGLLQVVVRHASVPVTLKIRAGWDSGSLNARDVALYAQDTGIKALFIHGRSRAQCYRGSVNYDIIRSVKEALSIPVIGSGDVLSPQLAKRMLDETGCDGVCIARGALGNPWIFSSAERFLMQRTLAAPPGHNEIITAMKAHLSACCAHYGEAYGTMLFRKFFAWYTKGFYRIRPLRARAFRATTQEQMLEIIGRLQSVRIQDEQQQESA